ncbi:SAM-dependent methyltransferase [Thermopolyspora sp. NPDC052614]|uniref:SAM-dependent methyltransferase n=1 Tax=Thermopolyspora sp. NPDC052614 TaxID=3155682 RepID=UPI0034320CA0
MADAPLPDIDTSVPHSARVWNYWLGGKDNYAVDRDLGDKVVAVYPAIRDLARASRQFLARAMRYLVQDAGIRQFLDIGTGLPTVDNTHEIAQRLAPESRIVYVDNDPLVLTHARALLTSSPEGKTDYVDADLRDPATILRQAAETLDFDRPIALILNGIMGHIEDYAEARSIVARLVEALPSGSYLELYDGSRLGEGIADAADSYNDSDTVPYYVRPPEEIIGFFDGLEPVEPGIVPIQEWRPDESQFGSPVHVDAVGGVARKP